MKRLHGGLPDAGACENDGTAGNLPGHTLSAPPVKQTSLKDHFRVVKPRLTAVAGCSGPSKNSAAHPTQGEQGISSITSSGGQGAKLLTPFKDSASKAQPRMPFSPSTHNMQPSTYATAGNASSGMPPFTPAATVITTPTLSAPACSDCAISISRCTFDAAGEDDACTNSCHNTNAAAAAATLSTSCINRPLKPAAPSAAAAHAPGLGVLGLCSTTPGAAGAPFFSSTKPPHKPAPASPAPSAPPAHRCSEAAAEADEITSGPRATPVPNTRSMGSGGGCSMAGAASTGTYSTWGAGAAGGISARCSLRECSTGSFRSWLPAKACSSSQADQASGDHDDGDGDDYADDAVSKGLGLGLAAAAPVVPGTLWKVPAAAAAVAAPSSELLLGHKETGEEGQPAAVGGMEGTSAAQTGAAPAALLVEAHSSHAGEAAAAAELPGSHLLEEEEADEHFPTGAQVEYQSRVDELVYGMGYMAEPPPREGWHREE